MKLPPPPCAVLLVCMYIYIYIYVCVCVFVFLLCRLDESFDESFVLVLQRLRLLCFVPIMHANYKKICENQLARLLGMSPQLFCPRPHGHQTILDTRNRTAHARDIKYRAFRIGCSWHHGKVRGPHLIPTAHQNLMIQFTKTAVADFGFFVSKIDLQIAAARQLFPQKKTWKMTPWYFGSGKTQVTD